MTTHAPTPADYAALRDYLDAFSQYREWPVHWPHVPVTDAGDARQVTGVVAGGRSDAGAIAARAAWWTALVAPRRESAADAEADAVLEAAYPIAGWRMVIESDQPRLVRWLHESVHPLPPPGLAAFTYAQQHGLTTRQLRARLAFVGATGVACATCDGTGGDGGQHPVSGQWEFTCDDCRGTGRVLPEPVPQRDASHGARCGCVRNYGAPVWESVHDPRCRFCSQSPGTVRDGRRDDAGAREYDNGTGHPARALANGIGWVVGTGGFTMRGELAHRREQPDACGHPYWFPFPHSKNKCRAPLADTLHGERDEPPDTSGHAGQAMGYVASGASRREPA